MGAKAKFDRACVSEFFARADQQIALVDFACAESLRQFVESSLSSCGEQEPRGSGIETVDDAGFARIVADLSHFRIASDERIDQGTGFARTNRSGWLPCGFEDDYDVIALEPDIENGIGGWNSSFIDRRPELDFDRFAALSDTAFLRHMAINANGTLFEKLFCPRATDRSQSFDNDFIQTKAVLLFANDDRNCAHLFFWAAHDSAPLLAP
jgi:hypothetical protein